MASSVWGLDAQTDMQKCLANADLGYLSINLIHLFCGVDSWGFYNNQPLNDDKVQQMHQLFHTMGPLVCQTDKVVYMAMNPEWYSNVTTPVITGKYMYQVPLLKLTPAGEQALADREFWLLSGNH